MWGKGWRERVWADLDQPWDIIVIGGGITGAGILREASRAGLKTLLVEGHDFASGTSSRSSKMVHGGLRYLRNAQIKLTIDSVHERERLLRDGRGLVEPLDFLMAGYVHDRPPSWVYGLGLMVYDLLALKWSHRRYSAAQLKEMCPALEANKLIGGYQYIDAQTDDARLVLRVIREAVRAGGTALNYANVEGLLIDRAGQVYGVQLREQTNGQTREARAPVVISAAGAWADRLRAYVRARPRLRPLRGSHLIFPWLKLPVTQAVNFLHPRDCRPVFAFPWEGVTLVGTTDVDHGRDLDTDPHISPGEAEYLMDGLRYAFAPLKLSLDDAQATLSGVRPVVDSGKANPSKESREFVLWEEGGLLTITGGKLTTFRLMAHDTLRAVQSRLPNHPKFDSQQRVLDPTDPIPGSILEPILSARLAGRYGVDAPELIKSAHPDELQAIASSPALWAELRWAARDEGAVHLDDLLLRRVRLGLLLPAGGLPLLERIRSIVQPELGWSDERWMQEEGDYARLWNRCYSVIH